MDILHLNNESIGGLVVDGITSKLWIERYREAGEFELRAPVSAGLREKLPIDSVVTHRNTRRVMIVENHEIVDSENEQAEVVVSGRSLETIFERRVIGTSSNLVINPTSWNGLFGADYSWAHAIRVLERWIGTRTDVYTADRFDQELTLSTKLARVKTDLAYWGSPSQYAERVIQPQNAYKFLLDLLGIDDCGIYSDRAGAWEEDPHEGYELGIYKGRNRYEEVAFHVSKNELESADYFWTNRNEINAVMITGKWVSAMVMSSEVGLKRRWMYLDGRAADEHHDDAPTASERTILVNRMKTMGQQEWARKNRASMTRVQVKNRAQTYKYREHYRLGDIVRIVGDYDVNQSMRVIEHVEIEDKTGEFGYPTLSAIP